MLHQSFVVVCVIFLARNGIVSSSPQKSATDLTQPLLNMPMADLTENMKTPATVDFYTKCVIGEGPCNAVGTALRSLLWDPVPGQPICYGCNENQMQRVRYVIDTMKAEYPVHACKIRAKLGEIRPIFNDVKC